MPTTVKPIRPPGGQVHHRADLRTRAFRHPLRQQQLVGTGLEEAAAGQPHRVDALKRVAVEAAEPDLVPLLAGFLGPRQNRPEAEGGGDGLHVWELRGGRRCRCRQSAVVAPHGVEHDVGRPVEAVDQLVEASGDRP
jgi:hypothetical protein